MTKDNNTVKYWEFDKLNHNTAVYEHYMNEAIKNKEWAETKNKELNGGEWIEASEVSREMLKSYLTKSLEEMAEHSYKYLRLRSHSFSKFNTPIDPPAYEKWMKLAGKLDFEPLKY